MDEHSPLVPIGDTKSPNRKGQVLTPKFAKFGARLSQSAEKAGLNAAQLAEAVEITRGTLSRYWNGERLPPADLLFRMADRISVDPRWLITGEHAGAADQEEQTFLTLFRRLAPAERAHLAQSAALLLGYPAKPGEQPPATVHSPRSAYRAEPGEI